MLKVIEVLAGSNNTLFRIKELGGRCSDGRSSSEQDTAKRSLDLYREHGSDGRRWNYQVIPD
jgi:hypothetical protein